MLILDGVVIPPEVEALGPAAMHAYVLRHSPDPAPAPKPAPVEE